MSLILIDTNVLVYFFDHNTPDKQERAVQVLAVLQQQDQGRLSVQSLAEFVSAVLRKLSPPLTASQAAEQVNLLAASWTVFDLTPQIVLEAARGVRDHHFAYFDAQIWATARLNQVPLVFSEDFQDRQVLEGVRFVNPFTEKFNIEEWI